jgi:hypothetical protein
LEKTVEQMTNAMYQYGDKVERMETKMGKMVHGFNEAVWECQLTANAITGTLTDDVHDKIKAAKDALASVTQKLKDQEDTITLLK